MLLLPWRDRTGDIVGVVSGDQTWSGRRPGDEDLSCLMTVCDHAALAVAQVLRDTSNVAAAGRQSAMGSPPRPSGRSAGGLPRAGGGSYRPHYPPVRTVRLGRRRPGWTTQACTVEMCASSVSPGLPTIASHHSFP